MPVLLRPPHASAALSPGFGRCRLAALRLLPPRRLDWNLAAVPARSGRRLPRSGCRLPRSGRRPSSARSLAMEFATGAMGSLIPKLGGLLLNEYNLKDSVKKGITDLKAELEAMEAALEKVSNVPLDQLDPQVKIWANEVRKLSYAIEDSIDSSMVRIEGLEPTNPHSFRGFIKKTRNKVSKFKTRHRLGEDIKDVKVQVREVKERFERYKINDVVVNLVPTTVDPRLLAMYSKVSDLVGIEKAIDELTERLSEGDDASREKLKTLSIVGIGGLGKTTLAKEVYEKINKSFDCGGFVPVGRNPDTKKVLKDILFELDKEMYRHASTMDERQLINQLREFLAEKRYLIVIDDLWDIATWELLKCAIGDGRSGSRIIITTRICGIAEKVGGVYNIKPLSDENSRKLFYSRIFGCDQGIIVDNQYAEVSSEILRKCAGVPLSVITIASLLVGKQMEDWSEVYDSIGFEQEENRAVENMRKILSFSYYDLPPHLKTCLLHLNTVPEDLSVLKDSLIWVWIAEGFIPKKPGTRLYELGESYLNDLVNRSMVQLTEPSRFGKRIACRVHDMVLDLIRNLSSEVNFIAVYHKEQQITFPPGDNAHRLAIHKGNLEYNPSMEMGHVRSFSAIGWHNSRMPSLLSFRVLRVLEIYRCEFSVGGCSLEHIGKLVQLRYLGIVDTPAVELPKEIGHDLKFLQTLNVRDSGIEELPPSVGELSKLMSLRAGGGTRMMSQIGKLTSLENLQLRMVDKSPNFFTQMGNLTEVRVLNIRIDEIDESRHKDMVASLRKLHRIQDLVVLLVSEKRIHVADVWEDWMPPSVLREMMLSKIVLRRRPLWLQCSRVPHLFSLWLEVEVVDEQDLQILGSLPLLCCLGLTIWKMEGFSYSVGSNEFPRLKELDTNIEVITCEEGALPMLESLTCGATAGRKDGFGLVPGNMPMLQQVNCFLDCQYCTDVEATEAEEALKHMAEIHPNHPTLKIQRVNEDDEKRVAHKTIAVLRGRLQCDEGGADEAPDIYVQNLRSLITSLESLVQQFGGGAEKFFTYLAALRWLHFLIARCTSFLQLAEGGVEEVSTLRDQEQDFLNRSIEELSSGHLPADKAAESAEEVSAPEKKTLDETSHITRKEEEEEEP